MSHACMCTSGSAEGASVSLASSVRVGHVTGGCAGRIMRLQGKITLRTSPATVMIAQGCWLALGPSGFGCVIGGHVPAATGCGYLTEVHPGAGVPPSTSGHRPRELPRVRP
jgi:hypothetical protein